jgi:hypothetical protein
LSATSNSPGTITYSVVSGPASITDDQVTVTGVGSITVRASQASSMNYNGTSEDQSFTAAKATLTFTAENKEKAYGTSNPSLTYTITGYVLDQNASVLGGTTPAITTTATTNSNTGTYPITVAIGTLAATNL